MTTPEEQPAIPPAIEPSPADNFTLPPPPPINPPPVVFPDSEKATGRPVSVTIIGILFILAGVAEILGIFPQRGNGIYYTLSRLDSVIFLVAKLAVGIGLLKLTPWARVGAIYVMAARFALGNAFAVALLLSADSPLATMPGLPAGNLPIIVGFISLFIAAVVGAGMYALAIYFLTRPNVKEAFARR